MKHPKIACTISIMIVIAFLPGMVPTPSTSAIDTPYNPPTSDLVLQNLDFTEYMEGDIPTEIFLARSSGLNSSLRTKIVNNDMVGEIKQTYPETFMSQISCYMDLPTLEQYTISFRMNIDQWDATDSTGMTWYLKAGKYRGTGTYNVMFIEWYRNAGGVAAGEVGWKAFGNTSTGISGQKMNMHEWYNYTIVLNNDAKTLSLHVSNDTGYSKYLNTTYAANTESVKHLMYNPTFMFWHTRGGMKNATVYLDDILMTSPRNFVSAYPGTDASGANIMMTFDDGDVSSYTTAYPIINALGMTADVALIVNNIGDEPGSYMSWDQVRELAAAGWGICSHGLTHTSLTTIPFAQAQYEILKSKQYIEQNLTGYTVKRIVAPYDAWTDDMDAYALSVGYELTQINTIRWSAYNQSSDATLEYYLGLVRNSVGLISHPLTHAVRVDASTIQLTPDRLEWLLSLGVESVSSDQWLGMYASMISFSPTVYIYNDTVAIENNGLNPVNTVVALNDTIMEDWETDAVLINADTLKLIPFTITENGMVFLADPGVEYKIITAEMYSEMRMDSAYGLLAAGVTFAVIITVIGMVISQVKRIG